MPTTNDRRLVTGLFPDRASAEAAYNSVSERGYGKDDVDVVMSDDTRNRHFATAGTETELCSALSSTCSVLRSFASSAPSFLLGAIAAAVAAVGTSVAIPGLGLVVAGPLAAALAGAGAGAASGGLVGALIGWSIPEERVKRYEEGLKNGGILMGLRAKSDEDAEHFERHWTSANGQHVYR